MNGPLKNGLTCGSKAMAWPRALKLNSGPNAANKPNRDNDLLNFYPRHVLPRFARRELSQPANPLLNRNSIMARPSAIDQGIHPNPRRQTAWPSHNSSVRFWHPRDDPARVVGVHSYMRIIGPCLGCGEQDQGRVAAGRFVGAARSVPCRSLAVDNSRRPRGPRDKCKSCSR